MHFFDFFKNEDWTKTQSPPTIFFVCPDEKTEQYILRFTKKAQEEQSVNLPMFTSTRELIEKQSILDSIWNQIE